MGEYVELVILDEAERLNTAALEYLRDIFDRNDIGLILIGRPGIEKRMSRVGVPLQQCFQYDPCGKRWRALRELRLRYEGESLSATERGGCLTATCKGSPLMLRLLTTQKYFDIKNLIDRIVTSE